MTEERVRVIDELSEMHTRLWNMRLFVGGPEFNGLPSAERALLIAQEQAMTAYYHALFGMVRLWSVDLEPFYPM